MSVVWHEIRKIWNWKILLLILAFCALFYYMNMQWHISTMRNPQPSSERTDFVGELVRRYGQQVTDEQMQAFFFEHFPQLIAEAEAFIQSSSTFTEAGIHSFRDYRAMLFLYAPSAEQFELMRFFSGSEANFIGSALSVLEWMQSSWTRRSLELEWAASRELFAWTQKLYQNAIASDNLAEFTAEQRAALEAEADLRIARSSLFASYGISDYAEFRAFFETNHYDLYDHMASLFLWNTLMSAEYGFVEMKINRLRAIEFTLEHDLPKQQIQNLEFLLQRHQSWSYTEREHRRLEAIIENGEYRNIMPPAIYNHARILFSNLSFLIMISVLILVAPLLAIDRMRSMQSLQYTAKIGRGLMYRQFAAVLVSAFALAVILIAVFGAIVYSTGMFAFWNHGLVSFLNGPYFLLPLTLGNLLTIMTLMGLVISLAVACAAFILSRFSRSLLDVLIKVIPLAIALNFINRAILGMSGFGAPPFGFTNTLYRVTRIIGTEAIACILLLVLALAAAFWISQREKRVDLA